VTPEQLLAREPESVTTDMRWLWGFYFSHVPEMHRRCGGQHAWRKRVIAPGVSMRVYKHHAFDLRRVWRLASVHVDDKPVMIVRNAGREGDDYADRYVFDLYLYSDLVERLGRKPNDRRRGPKTRLGWQSSLAEFDGEDEPLLDVQRADGFFARTLDSPAEDWRPY